MPSRFRSGPEFEDYALFHPEFRVSRPEEICRMNIRAAIAHCISRRNLNRYERTKLHNPPAKWVNDVHALVAEKMGLGVEGYEAFKVFPAIGTSLDRHHKIDFFFHYQDPISKKEALISVDLTINPKKDASKCKADLIVSDEGGGANPNLYQIRAYPGYFIPYDKDAADRIKVAHENMRREQLANLIVRILKYKLHHGDPNHDNALEDIDLEKILAEG